LDEGGRLLYGATLNSRAIAPIVNASNNTGLWMYDFGTGSSTLVARGGDAAPGLASLLLYQPKWGLVSGGKIAFRSTLRGSVTVGVDDSAIFSGTPGGGGSLTARARLGVSSGAGAPAGVPGAQFALLDYPRMSAGPSANIAFRGELKTALGGPTSANNEGIWKESSGAVNLLAREGDAAPGLPGLLLGPLGQPFVGENGRVCFNAKLVAGSSTPTAGNDSAWFSERSDGSIAPLLREGDVLPTEVGPRTVGELYQNYATPEDNRTMNIHGVMCYQVPFVGAHTGLVILVSP
jgi:hypothetical protein